MDGKFAPKRGTRCWLFEALERLKTGKDAVASKALKLATKCPSRLSRPEKRAPAPRMSELMIPASNSDRPALLENRIFLLPCDEEPSLYFTYKHGSESRASPTIR